MYFLAYLLTLVSTASLLVAEDAVNSRIYFRSGGSLAGRVIAETKDAGKSYVVIKSDSGSIFKIEKSKVKRVATPGPERYDYQQKLQSVDTTTSSGHWEVYNWCRSNEKRTRLRDQMKFHLREIVRLDPSDDDAWRRLGEVGEPYVKVDGTWVPEEQHYSSLGYVKVKGRWTPEVLSVEKQRKAAAEAHLDSRKVELKNFRKNVLKKGNPAEIRKVLSRVIDPTSLVFFESQFVRKEDSNELRALYLEAIGQVKSPVAQRILVNYAIKDANPEVRDTAMLLLEQEIYPPESTVNMASSFLRNKSNELVNRAGLLIGRMENTQGIIPLIGSLITEHKVATGSDPGRTNAGFGSGGGVAFSPNEGPKFAVVKRKNEAVRRALYDITGQDFGYDSSLWRKWYISEHTSTNYNVRDETDE